MVTIFQERTWYQLRAASQALRLPFDTHWSRRQAQDRLRGRAIDGGELKRRLVRLTRRERRALQTLQASGPMIRSRFSRHFGGIRICRQRHPVSEAAVWRIPYSPAERLWLFGFVEILPGRPEHIALTDEAAQLLPPLPIPVRGEPLNPQAVDERTALCRDLAVWLGSLAALKARPLHVRWIALTALRRLNDRLPRPEALDGVRSELGTGRLRFLHYLAEAAGLVASTGARLLPTPAAWRWLEQPPHEQWAALWSALEADRRAGSFLWRRYRLPDVTEPAWTALIDRLRRAPPASYALESLVAAILPYCPPPFERWEEADQSVQRSIATLLDTVLPWMGIARRAGDWVEMPTRDGADAMPAHQRARIEETPEALLVRLPEHPAPLPLAQALDWADLSDWTLIVDAPAMRRAWGQGVSAVTSAGILAELCGPLPNAWLDRLQAWEREARSLRLRRMPVLTADDPSVLDALCADRGLRALIDQPLSAHHLAVHADQVDALCRRLERRGFPVTHALPADSAPCSTSSGTSRDPAAAAYAYLAMRVFQKLADFAPLPLHLPAAARDTVAAHIADPNVIDDLDRMAERVLDALTRVVQGDAPPSPVHDAPAESIRTTLRQAYDAQEAVTIDYFSPARGAITTRRIAPLRWIERGGAVYVEAWCELDGDTRTFRVDRVLRVVSSPDPPGAAPDGDPETGRTGE